jgi:hypothetical protein
MAREPDPFTLADLVRRAVAITDPDEADPALAEFEQRFEDADEPVTAVASLEERIAWGADEDPGVIMAQAVVLYLAHRRDSVDDDPGDVLSLAARAEFDGDPPEPVLDWLAGRGVRV